jgi:hypothetical protein
MLDAIYGIRLLALGGVIAFDDCAKDQVLKVIQLLRRTRIAGKGLKSRAGRLRRHDAVSDENTMRSESEVHPCTVLDRTPVPPRAVGNTLSFIFLVAAILQLGSTQAQVIRTYVSGTGNANNPCTFTSPCRTLHEALQLTRSGGEVRSLDSVDYGYVPINQAVTVLSAHGATGVLAAKVSGAALNAGADDLVTLKGLEIKDGRPEANGIEFNLGAALNIQARDIRKFATGISFQPKAASSISAADTMLSKLSQISSAGSGVLTDAHLVNGASDAVVQGASSASIARPTVQNGAIANNSTVGVRSDGYSIVNVSGTTFASNLSGVQAQGSKAVIQLAGSTMTGSDSDWNNSTGGNIAANSAPPTSPSLEAKNIVSDFGAKCNGMSDDTRAFMKFNSWARAQTLPINLTIPPGSACQFLSPIAFAAGIKNLVVNGYGASFQTNQGSFYLGGFGIIEKNTASALIATAAAGATSIRLLTATQSSRFTVGKYVLLTGGDLQGYGYPPNPWVFEYALITAVDSTSGTITLGAPLQNGYSSTWPSYRTGSAFSASAGGPATVYALDPSWDTAVEYRGLTISGNVQTYANGRSIKFTDVRFNGCATSGGLAPTQALSVLLTNVTMLCQMEVDKLVANFDIEGGTFDQLLFQSSSGAARFTMNDATVATLNGTPQQAIVANSSIRTLIPGTLHFGRTSSIACNACSIGLFWYPPGGSLDTNVDTKYTMSEGVITVPNTTGPVAWAVPGANAMFAVYNGDLAAQGIPFTVVDLTQDAKNTYIYTSLAGGFPALPRNRTTGLSIYGHPSPQFTCSNCTGGIDAMDLAQAPAGAPLYSYSKRTFTGSNLPLYLGQNLTLAHIWGSIVSIKINVVTPYTGVQPALSLNALAPYGIAAIASNQTSVAYNPVIDLKVSGERQIFPSSLVGIKTTDAVSLPGSLWLENAYSPTISADISNEPPSVWPTVTIEIVTDQGIVSPR